jgi:YbbR domain-containing protein
MDYRKLLLKIAEDWPAKVLSIALAIVLFVFHRMNSMEERFFSVPLHVETDGNYTVSSPYERTIRISMKGEANSIYTILEGDIEAYVDLKGKNSGHYNAPVLIRKEGAAVGVDPLEITVDPTGVSLTIDLKVSKYAPLAAVQTRGELKAGYRLVSSTLTPDRVVIEGPSGIIANIADLSTEDIDLDNRDSDFSVTVNILNHEPLTTIRGSGTAEFRGYVEEIKAQKIVDKIPIIVSGLDDKNFRAELAVGIGKLTLSGRQQNIESWTPNNMEILSIDCSDIHKEGTYDLPVTVKIPSTLRIEKKEPETVRVQIIARNPLPDE